MESTFEMNREKALEVTIGCFGPHDICVGTTGFLSRELEQIREKDNKIWKKDFLCVGSMGHASSIALGISL